MVRIRILLFGLFCWIGVMLAIGRVDLTPVLGDVTPALYVYLIAAATMGILIAYPEYAKRSLAGMLFAVLGLYGVFALIENLGLVINGSFISQTAIDVALLSVTVYIARNVSSTVASTEQTIRSALLPWYGFTVLNEEDGEKAITEEILRARRYERPLTLVHISIPQLRRKLFTRWSHKKLLEYEYANLRIIQLIRNVIYDSDIITWHGSDLVVCLPETSPEEATVVAFPLEALLRTSLRDGAKVSMAHFPGDALVYKDLLAAAKAGPTVKEPAPEPKAALLLEGTNLAAFEHDEQTADEADPPELVRVRQTV
jgi:hypothetical protein